MDEIILPLLQLCDSNFPNGSFSHSFGLETYIQEGLVKDKETFYSWLKVFVLEQLVYSDLLASRLVYEVLNENNHQKIWEIDHILNAQMLASETRDGSIKIGKRLISIGDELYPSPSLKIYKEQVNSQSCYGHPAVAFTIIAHNLKIPKQKAAICYLYSIITSLVQNAVRGIPLGQMEGQQLIKESQSLIHEAWKNSDKLTVDQLGITAPGIEISQMRHEGLFVRMFMS